MSAADPIGAGLVKTVIDEIVALHYNGHIRSIAVVFVDEDGDIGTKFAIAQRGKLSILAATVLLQADVVGTMSVIQKDRDG